MTTASHHYIGNAFDQLASSYDDSFSNTAIGRAQRFAVWRVIDKVFHRGDRVLELNCGTGEDAAHLAESGVNLDACDASSQMLSVARKRHFDPINAGHARFHQVATENIARVFSPQSFDGVFSDFGGLNCVHELDALELSLARLVRPGGHVALCWINRTCLWELITYGVRRDASRAFRRLQPRTTARIGDASIEVNYPSVTQIKRAFAPHFYLRSISAVGLCVPPSYAAAWAVRHPHLLRMMSRIDRVIAKLPLLRACGDHVLFVFERTR